MSYELGVQFFTFHLAMLKIQADYVFPIHTAPIPNGIVVLDDAGYIVQVARAGAYNPDEVRQLSGILCPGFVNTHCHIELSHLKGVIPEGTGLINFLQPIGSLRQAYDPDFITEQITLAEQEMWQNGIVAVGDIANTTHSLQQKSNTNLLYHTFVEIFGLNPARAMASMQSGINLCSLFRAQKQHRCSLAPHAPYSASASLLSSIALYNNEQGGITSIHNQECTAEDELFRYGTGAFVAFYQNLGLGNIADFFTPPGTSSLRYVLDSAANAQKMLLIHNTYTSRADITEALTRFAGSIYWCFCPNANLYIENQLPNFDAFLNQPDWLTIGTDSLTSNRQLCVLSELKTIARHAPHIPLQQLLTWATLNGAKALGFSHQVGSLQAGKRPGLVWINNINLNTLQLTPQSRATKVA